MTEEKTLLTREKDIVLGLLYTSINVLFITYLPCQNSQWVLAVLEFGWMTEDEGIVLLDL